MTAMSTNLECFPFFHNRRLTFFKPKVTTKPSYINFPERVAPWSCPRRLYVLSRLRKRKSSGKLSSSEGRRLGAARCRLQRRHHAPPSRKNLSRKNSPPSATSMEEYVSSARQKLPGWRHPKNSHSRLPRSAGRRDLALLHDRPGGRTT